MVWKQAYFSVSSIRGEWCTGMQRSSKAKIKAVWLLYLCKTPLLSTSSKWNMSYLSSTGVDLVNTVSRDNVSIQSNPVEDRYEIFYFEDVDNEGVLQRYNSHTTAVCALLLLCIPVHQSCLVICMPWRKQATLVMNEGGDDWSSWNDRVNENNGMIVVQECKKCLSEIVH